jgi:hypothetical protein
MAETTYLTKFWNKRRKPVNVWERGGVLITLAPNAIQGIESVSPYSSYARWDEVIYEDPEQVQLHVRDGWIEPQQGRWIIEFVNIDGAEIEKRVIEGTTMFLPKLIPILVAVNAADPLAKFHRVEIRRVLEREPSGSFPGYYVKRLQLKEVKYDRPSSELKELESDRKSGAKL